MALFVCRKARFYNQPSSFNHQSDGKLIQRGLATGERKGAVKYLGIGIGIALIGFNV